jgi:hypothetical protein
VAKNLNSVRNNPHFYVISTQHYSREYYRWYQYFSDFFHVIICGLIFFLIFFCKRSQTFNKVEQFDWYIFFISCRSNIRTFSNRLGLSTAVARGTQSEYLYQTQSLWRVRVQVLPKNFIANPVPVQVG